MNKHFSKNIKKYFLAAFIIVIAWLSFGLGAFLAGREGIIKRFAEAENIFVGQVTGKYKTADNGRLAQDIDFDLFWEVWDDLNEMYVDKEHLNEKELFYGAIKGMVAAVGDPYTVFMDPQISKEFDEDMSGSFEGIGAEIGIKEEILTIVAPLPDMPAEKAGLKAGDQILMINGESTQGMAVDLAVSKIRGPKDTEVVLSVYRDGFAAVKDFAIKRDKIVIKSVITEDKDGISYIRITSFNDDTRGLFDEAVRKIVADNPAGIILDLRNDPGGYLDTSIEVASEWIEKDVVVQEKSNEKVEFQHLSRGRARLKNFPTVVLINQGSASASEIVAGALQDYGLAKLIGEQSFGKGSVQSLTKLSDGSSVKITVTKWLTPQGRSINDEGIAPDYAVELTLADFEAGRDPQLEAALKFLRGEDISALATTTAPKAE